MITIKKIGALIGSLVMIGATAGMAAAANFPAPFVVGGGADVALVYGADAAISDYAASA